MRPGEIEASTPLHEISKGRKELISNGGVILLGMARTFILPAGLKGFDVYRLNGTKTWSYRRENLSEQMKVSLPTQIGNGAFKIKTVKN